MNIGTNFLKHTPHDEICKHKCGYMLGFSNYTNIFSGIFLIYQNIHISNKYNFTHTCLCIQMMHIYRVLGNLWYREE